MQIVINKESQMPIYIQIKKQLSDMIIKGQLPSNFILPPERTLARQLNVNRSTVVRAYMELKAEGYIQSKQGSGTVVLSHLGEEVVKENTYVPPLRWGQLESKTFSSNKDVTISKILSVFETGKTISFASGIMSEDIYNIEKFKQLQTDLYDKYKEKLFMPTPVDGNHLLKNLLRNYLAENGMRVNNKELLVTTGSQQTLEFIAKYFIEAGDVVIIEEPTYPGAIQVFESYGAKIIGIPMESDGMDLDILETCLIRYKPKFIYTQPDFQNPTGITMSLNKRKELLKLAYYYQVPIIEDNPYRELRLEGETLPTLRSLDRHEYVIYLSSFSKSISFSIRVGYAIASEQVIERFKYFKQISDIQTSTQSQYLVAEIFESGFFKEHINSIIMEYRKKRDKMIQMLSQTQIEGFKLFVPQGGFFIWCKLPDEIRLSELMHDLAKSGIVVMPGEVFFCNERINENYLRLNFSYPKEEDIEDGCKKLIACIKQCLRNKKSYTHEISSKLNPFL